MSIASSFSLHAIAIDLKQQRERYSHRHYPFSSAYAKGQWY